MWISGGDRGGGKRRATRGDGITNCVFHKALRLLLCLGDKLGGEVHTAACCDALFAPVICESKMKVTVRCVRCNGQSACARSEWERESVCVWCGGCVILNDYKMQAILWPHQKKHTHEAEGRSKCDTYVFASSTITQAMSNHNF